MNTGTPVSKKALPCLFLPNWKKLSKKVRWTFLGLWTQEDETAFIEAREHDSSIKPCPRFAEVTGYSKAKREARK
jgi:hypothetical protein